MESTPSRPSAAEASAALLDAEATRATLAGDIRTPSWLFASIGVAVAVQIATTALAVRDERPWLMVAGLVAFAVVAAVQLARFRRANGVWLGGFASRVVLGTSATASVAHVAMLAAAIWAAQAERSWLVGLCSIVGGAGYALTGRRWVGQYRGAPAEHARGEALALVVVLGVVAVGALVLLVLGA